MRHLVVALLLVTAVLPGVAEAAYPGANGRIAFMSNRDDNPPTGNHEIYSMNSDGSDPKRLTIHPNEEQDPAWSPDGTKIAFWAHRDGAGGIFTMDADGASQVKITPGSLSDPGGEPSWSPDGRQIAFEAKRSGGESLEIYVINSDGSGTLRRLTLNTVADADPAWSPDGTKIAYSRFMPDPPCAGYCNFEIFVMDTDGTDQTRVTFDTAGPRQDNEVDWSPDAAKLIFQSWGDDGQQLQVINPDGSGRTSIPTPAGSGASEPAWSPDGSQIVWSDSGFTDRHITVMDSDGGNPQAITAGGFDGSPSWQPLPPHVRPLSATPIVVSLVPAYSECTGAGNRRHGPPLNFPSCAPPQQASPNLTVRVPNGDNLFKGFVRFAARLGPPGGPDDTDMRLRASLSHVMNASDLSEYTGELRVTAEARVTDKDNGVSGTIQDFRLDFDVPCVTTSDPNLKSTCDVATGLDAVVPGASPEGTRAVWALEQVRVYDGGPDEDADTEADNSLFAVQGVFVP